MCHIAIILARGGSKRLPGKNILDFHGKAMLQLSVEAAISSKKYSHVLVSTDDPVIAAIGLQSGASVPFLRDSASDDFASSSEATLYALRQAESYWNIKFQCVSQLMANCPLRNSLDIISAVEHFEFASAESQISCFRFGWMNPWWAAKITDEGKPDYVFGDERIRRSQDLPPLYCPSGALWIAKCEALMAHNTFYSPNHIFHEIDWISAMDIDDTEDLEMAKLCYLRSIAKKKVV